MKSTVVVWRRHRHHHHHHRRTTSVVVCNDQIQQIQQQQQQIRSFATRSDTTTNGTPKLTSWESGARLVKNTHVENQYLDHIRDIHDPSLHLKTIEDELKGTIGKALGRQGEKILNFLKLMEQERQQYEILRQQQPTCDTKLSQCAKQHNHYRKLCIHARWELMVHRQAVGFIVNNHKFVMEKFPIGDPLPEDNVVGEQGESSKPEEVPKEKKKFGDQLEWWQRVGRWR